MAHCHGCEINIEVPAGGRRIVLAGNPNAGKSVVFNELTGMYVDVSNYPGTTLDISHGKLGRDVIIDTPGVYGISSFNDEERVARDVILSADIIVNVVNAVYLERDLFLTLQIIDTGLPTLVVLNMMDEAESQGLIIDHERLSELLGVPVIPAIAVKKVGIDKLRQSLDQARPGKSDPALDELLPGVLQTVDNRGEALLILEGDPAIAERHGMQPLDKREEIYLRRRQRVNWIVEQVVTDTNKRSEFVNNLGRWMIKPLTGIPILLLTLYVTYQVVGVFVAGNIVDFLEGTVMQGYYEPFIRGLVSKVISEDSAISYVLVGEFGVLTMSITYVFGLLLPLVAGFYFILSLFEDSGYLPRIATLVDRALMKIGLNGRGIIPLVLGLGCVTMATITTRLLGSERERRIAIFLLALTIPCSAQMAVIATMIGSLGMEFVVLYAVVVLGVFIMAGTWINSLLPGKSTDLLIDLPPLRWPRIGNVLRKTAAKTYHFLSEAFPLFVIGALIISVLQITGILEALQNLLAPLTVTWLGLPKETATAFVMGVVRRDFGAAGLLELTMTPVQTIIAIITITLFVPCIASIMVILKERPKKEGTAMWLGTWAIAFVVGGVVHQFFKLWGTTAPYQVLGVALTFGVLAVLLAYLAKRLEGRRNKTSFTGMDEGVAHNEG